MANRFFRITGIRKELGQERTPFPLFLPIGFVPQKTLLTTGIHSGSGSQEGLPGSTHKSPVCVDKCLLFNLNEIVTERKSKTSKGLLFPQTQHCRACLSRLDEL